MGVCGDFKSSSSNKKNINSPIVSSKNLNDSFNNIRKSDNIQLPGVTNLKDSLNSKNESKTKNNRKKDDIIQKQNNCLEKTNFVSFRCTYDIKDNNEIQIINNRFNDDINEEIIEKIKILNGNQKEELLLKKKI